MHQCKLRSSATFRIYTTPQRAWSSPPLVLNRGGLPREVAVLYGKFKTVYVLRIPLVIEFGSDHIKRNIHHFSIDLLGSLIDQ